MFDNSAYSKTNIFSNASVSVKKGAADSSSGVLFFQDIVFYLKPGTNTTISLDTTIILSSYIPTFTQEPLEYSLILTICSRFCIIGEKYNPSDSSCSLCPDDTFSLSEPMSLYFQKNTTVKCEKCPDNAYCYNGSFITPLSGYYRHSNASRLIVECITPEACRGYQENLTLNEKIHGVCEIHQYGPLCYVCEIGYARMSTKKLCETCAGNAWTYIRIVLAAIAIFLYIYVQVKLTFKANQTTYMGILLKLLMNHLQQISMISLINLGWTPDFKMFFNYQQYLSFISEDFISIDCFVQDLPFNLLAKKVIFSNILPILLSVIAFVIWIFSWSFQLVLKKAALKNYLLNRTKVTSLIVTYILFPEILRKCFSLLNCIKIDDDTNEETLLLSPELMCWQPLHIDYLLCGSVPGLIVWGLITPGFLTYLLVRFRINIKENIEIMQRKFLLLTSLKKLTQARKGSDNGFEIKLKKQEFMKPEVAIFHRIHPVLNALTSQKTLSKEKKDNFGFKKSIAKLEFNRKKTMLANRLSITNLNVKKETKDPQANRYNSPTMLKGSIFIKKSEEISAEDPDLKVKLEHEITINLDGLTQREVQLQEEFGSLLKFLYKGYAAEFYYWEIVLYTKKFFLIFIGSFSEFFPSTTKATILLIILTYFLFIQTRKKPFETDFLNNVEYFSLIVTFVTSNIGIILFTKDLYQYGQYFLIIVIVFNLSFFGLWLFYFYQYVVLRNELGLLNRINGVFKFLEGISVKNNGNIKILCKKFFVCIIKAGIKICQRRSGLENIKKGRKKVALNKKKKGDKL